MDHRMLDLFLIGDMTRPEFRLPHTMLLDSACVDEVPDLAAAQARLQGMDSVPQLAVVAVAYPGQFPNRHIELFCRAVPLIKTVALLGSWCEGETRTGQPWPADARVWWYHWPWWWARQMMALAAGRCPAWDLPRTATDQDRTLAGNGNDGGGHIPNQVSNFQARSNPPLPAPRDRQQWVAIATRDYAAYVALNHALAVAGYTTIWHRPHRRSDPTTAVAAGIWDGGQMDPEEQAAFVEFQHAFPDVPAVVLLDFPRIEVVTEMLASGAKAVLGKPYAIDDLALAIDRCCHGF